MLYNKETCIKYYNDVLYIRNKTIIAMLTSCNFNLQCQEKREAKLITSILIEFPSSSEKSDTG